MQNGQEAFQTFAESPAGTYNIILMDIQMPVMDGYQASEAIRALTREDARTVPILALTANAFATENEDAKTIPILAMSANAFQEDVARSMDAGMNEHLSKPIDMETLFCVIGRFLPFPNL